jgi:hypothetical protein
MPYMSQIHTNPDMAVEIFVLEPGGEQPVDPDLEIASEVS